MLQNLLVTPLRKNKSEVLITGGGSYNKYWINLLKNNYDIDCIIPQNNIIDFKEALIFAFLGVMRLEKNINILKTVTGASRDNIGGVIHFG